MKGIRKAGILIMCTVLLMAVGQVFAATEDKEETIKQGVSIDSVDVSGMTYNEAKEAIEEIVDKKAAVKVSITVNNDVVETTLGKLGYKWANKSILTEAVEIGKYGSVIKRYKDELDLKNEGMKYDLEMKIDQDTLKKKLEKICKPYNVEAKNASLKATGSGFQIIPEKEGCVVNYDTSTEALYKYITETWDGKSDIKYVAETEVSKPKYTTEDCKKVSNTPMGSFTTNFTVGSSYNNRNLNIKNGAEKIDGNVLYPGEQFSCNEHLAPWTKDNGWYPAGTYVDGGVQDSLGGGICQVSSTLYNALLKAEIKVVKRFSHSMAVSYVDLAADAALAGDYKDLVFENDTDAPIYVQGVYNAGGSVTFNIYGHDTRKASHSVSYESELVSTTPIKESVTKDSSKPAGYKEVVENGHVGYVAKLWKITYENGKQVSKELLHTSTYAMSPRKVIKGTGKSDKKDDEDETTKKTDEKATKKASEDTTKKNTKKDNKKSSED
ncbi:MAG: VanW family protein [Eubacterium sp.]